MKGLPLWVERLLANLSVGAVVRIAMPVGRVKPGRIANWVCTAGRYTGRKYRVTREPGHVVVTRIL